MTYCPECLEQREEKDFYGKKICFKCEYKKKIKNSKYIKKLKKCKVCGKILETTRWKYCGEACASVGHKEKKENFWKKNLRHLKLIV